MSARGVQVVCPNAWFCATTPPNVENMRHAVASMFFDVALPFEYALMVSRADMPDATDTERLIGVWRFDRGLLLSALETPCVAFGEGDVKTSRANKAFGFRLSQRGSYTGDLMIPLAFAQILARDSFAMVPYSSATVDVDTWLAELDLS